MKNQETIRSILAERAVHPDRPALSWYFDGRLRRRYSYRELLELVSIAAVNLTQQNVYRLDRVIVLSNNSPEMFILCLAIMSIGAVVVPINPAESTRSLKYILSSIRPRLVVLSGDVALPVINEIEQFVRVSISELFHPNLKAHVESDADFPQAGDVAVILFTSGTTSESKGVCLSHKNLIANAKGLSKLHNLRENQVHLCVLPLFHANAFGYSLLTSVFSGSHVVLCNGFPGFGIWSIIEQERVNIASVVPQLLQVLAARRSHDSYGDHLRYFVCAAAPLSKEVAREFMAATGVKICQGYGLSECVNFATAMHGGVESEDYEALMFEESVTCIGAPVEGCDVQIRQLNGFGLASEGQEGEVVVTGETLMSGYWENIEASEKAIVGGELRTGDLGFWKMLKGDRFFYITGRIKEIIIRNGEKFSPLAIEAEFQGLRRHGKFAVVGFENQVVGEEIGLYLQVGNSADISEIIGLLSACPVSSRPRIVMRGLQEIPVTATGKIKRELLRKRFSIFSGRAFGAQLVVVDEVIAN